MKDLPTFLQPMTELSLDDGGAGIQSKKDQGSVANFTMTCQEDKQWCWAAVAQAVEDWQGRTVSQLVIASQHIAGKDDTSFCDEYNENDPRKCGSCNTPRACNEPHSLSTVLKERNLLHKPPTNQAPEFETIRGAINQNRPLPVRIQWNGSETGHFVCVTGYAKENNERYVVVHDPILPKVNGGPADARTFKYDDFVRNYHLQPSHGFANFYYEVTDAYIS